MRDLEDRVVVLVIVAGGARGVEVPGAVIAIAREGEAVGRDGRVERTCWQVEEAGGHSSFRDCVGMELGCSMEYIERLAGVDCIVEVA